MEFSTVNPFERFRAELDQYVALYKSEVAEKKKTLSSRSELFKELYGYYEQSYKKNSWEAYRKWLAKNRFKHSKDKVAEFKKSKEYRKQIPIKSFCSHWFGFLKTDDLYYLLSVARDKMHRGENLNKWLFWAIKKQ